MKFSENIEVSIDSTWEIIMRVANGDSKSAHMAGPGLRMLLEALVREAIEEASDGNDTSS